MAAASQIFFTLGVGFGIIINYASYLKPDDDVGGFSQGREKPPFHPDAFQEALARERVWSPGRLIPRYERLVRRLQEDHLMPHACLPQLLQCFA